MGLFSGLGKSGTKAKGADIASEEVKKVEKAAIKVEAPSEIPTEDSFLFDKTTKCPVCDKVFKTRTVKSGKARRLEPDVDLRPRFRYIDTLKYDVASCPFCGYTAMTRYFDHVSPTQSKWIVEQVSSKFTSGTGEEPAVYDYDMAIDRYKRALFHTTIKRGKGSEVAYTCLKIAWLYRGKLATLDPRAEDAQAERNDCMEQEETYYSQAYEGFMGAVSSEMFPICGMDQDTMDYLLAVMSAHFKKYDVAKKCISRVLTSATASKTMKDRAIDLKEEGFFSE